MDSSPSSSGASNAADFQPPTGNPQQNVGGNLQPLVPTPQNDVFNQPKINSQELPQTNSLSVTSNGAPNTSNPSVNSLPSSNIGWFNPMTFMIIVIFMIATLLLIAKSAKPLPKPANEEPVTKTKSTHSKSKSKKKSKSRKKSRK